MWGVSLPTKVSRRFLEDGTKVRVSRTSNTVIPKPEWKREKPRSSGAGALRQGQGRAWVMAWVARLGLTCGRVLGLRVLCSCGL